MSAPVSAPSAPLAPPQSARAFIGTLHAQLTGRRYYAGAAAAPGARLTLSRTNADAVDCRRYDPNATVVLNSSGKTVGTVARDFAAWLAPVVDGALADLQCAVPLLQRAGGSAALQHNPGEQLDLDIALFASAEELPRLQALGVLARLHPPSAAAAPAASSTPAAKRARDPAAAGGSEGEGEGAYTTLRSVAGGRFLCAIVVGGREEVHTTGIRFPDAWLAQNQERLAWADELVVYRVGAAGEREEVLRRGCMGVEAAEQAAESKRAAHKRAKPVLPSARLGGQSQSLCILFCSCACQPLQCQQFYRSGGPRR